MDKPKVLAIVGPSASGKTKLAIELAKQFNGEIVSVDSRQIYKELNIGSAKPTIEERQGIIHHLIDIVDLTTEYTVANFCDDANVVIKKILEKGKIPILCGGTGLYFRVLLQDFDLPRVSPNNELRDELEKLPSEELYEQLCKQDNVIAQKIHPNNRVKIIRALEVCKILGIPMSKAQRKKESDFNVMWVGLNSLNREYLYNRINNRVDKMLDEGLLDEVEMLYKKYGDNKILLETIGYKELLSHIKGKMDFKSSIELLKQDTRRYAKRQISWFNANKSISWFEIETDTEEKIINAILKHI